MENKDLEQELETLKAANKTLREVLDAKNKLLEQEIENIKSDSKKIADMKPWDIEVSKLHTGNIKTTYGKQKMCDAMNAYLAENNQEQSFTVRGVKGYNGK